MGFSVKGLFGEEKLYFWVMIDVSSPRRTSIRLGEGPPRRRGLPRRGQLSLGEPGNMEYGLSRRTTLPMRRWATPRCACDYLRPVFMAYFGSVSWPDLHVIVACFVGHCVTCLGVSLLGKE